jgi:hypothetical protein
VRCELRNHAGWWGGLNRISTEIWRGIEKTAAWRSMIWLAASVSSRMSAETWCANTCSLSLSNPEQLRMIRTL